MDNPQRQNFIENIFDLVKSKPGIDRYDIYTHPMFADYMKNGHSNHISESLFYLEENNYIYIVRQFSHPYDPQGHLPHAQLLYPYTLSYLWKKYENWYGQINWDYLKVRGLVFP